MNKEIWKFSLVTTDRQDVEMPLGAEILTLQLQNGLPCLWCLVNPSRELPKEYRHFEIFGTGNPVDCGMDIRRNYIGTYKLENGVLVFHVFERRI